ncbi:MAG: GTPase HflX [Bacteroidetes bacterium 4572_128]|nr:MAG: GTPase HflX [Bacteroidetes bacterium 4572_128]
MSGFLTKREKEKVVLVGIINKEQNEMQLSEYMEELSFLTETAGAIPVKKFVQKLEVTNKRTFVGSGKLLEIIHFVKENEIDIVIFDDELNATQLRNLEKDLKCKIMDRTGLILDIFAKRAKTATAKTQVEMAQYQYLLPRLTRMWTHLERQRGGIGLRGPGETEIETDRRIIRDKISKLKNKLKKIEKQKKQQRKNRGKMVRVSLVGYTNVGKSTLMNVLCKSDIFAENKLFATLDTTVRKLVIENIAFLISDTVGFIRKLPHNLVDSFKSTLDELKEADILIHVIDISHPNFEEQINTVNKTLKEVNANNKKILMIFNKIDAYNFVKKDEDDLTEKTKENYNIEELKNSWMAKNNLSCIFISAKEKINFEELKKSIFEEVKKVHIKRYPYSNFLY